MGADIDGSRGKTERSGKEKSVVFHHWGREPEPFTSLRPADEVEMSGFFVTIVDGNLQLPVLVS